MAGSLNVQTSINTCNSSKRRGSAFRRAPGPAVGVDSFPHFRTMDWNIGIDLEAQFHGSALNPEHRDLHEAMEVSGPADDHRFPAFP
jgi:hypothetical protein